MSVIYYIMGKSATGKDTVYKELLKCRPDLKRIVPYTTRPIREGEMEGVEYHFASVFDLEEMKAAGKVIELRTYQTVMGPWSYFTADDGQFEIDGDVKYLMIGTLESYEKLCDYFGQELVIPLYLELPDGIRLRRALERESVQKQPNYREVCRRYLADADDFSEEQLMRLKIPKRFCNIELDSCMQDILSEMQARS